MAQERDKEFVYMKSVMVKGVSAARRRAHIWAVAPVVALGLSGCAAGVVGATPAEAPAPQQSAPPGPDLNALLATAQQAADKIKPGWRASQMYGDNLAGDKSCIDPHARDLAFNTWHVGFFDPHGPDRQAPIVVTLDSTGKVEHAQWGFQSDGAPPGPGDYGKVSPFLPQPLPAMTPNKAVELVEKSDKPLPQGVCAVFLRPAGEKVDDTGFISPNAYYSITAKLDYYAPIHDYTVDTVTDQVRALPILKRG